MAKFDVNIRDLAKRRFSLETGESHRVVISKFDARRIEMADAHFNFDSAVLLADEGSPIPDPDSGELRITALAVLRACYLHAKNNPAARVVVAGHTDTVGTPGYNLTLSQLRADNVRGALVGDKDAWVKSAMAKSVVADSQRMLKFAAFTLGWDCDPGAVDNEDGPRTRKAMKGFQRRYNDEVDESIAVDGVLGRQTWQAFFDVYMLELQDLLDVDHAGLAQLQTGIKFANPAHEAVGCGENHPIEAATKDEFRSRTNRRVEILFFEPGHEPKFPCHPGKQQCKPALCEIYRGHFQLEQVPVDELIATQQLLLEWPDQLTPDLPSDLALVVSQGDKPEVVRPWSGGEVIDDHRRFKFEPFIPAVPCTVIARIGDGETTLWDEQHVDEPGNPPQWQHTLEELLVNPPASGDVADSGDLPPSEVPNDGDDFSA